MQFYYIAILKDVVSLGHDAIVLPEPQMRVYFGLAAAINRFLL